MEKRLTRNPNDKVVAGVCSGLADYLDIDVTIIRVLFLLLFIPGGLSPLLYLVFWMIMPERPATVVTHPAGAEPYRYDPYSGKPLV